MLYGYAYDKNKYIYIKVARKTQEMAYTVIIISS